MIKKVLGYTFFLCCVIRGCGRLLVIFPLWIWGSVGSWVCEWSFRFLGWRRRGGVYYCCRWWWCLFPRPGWVHSWISTSFAFLGWVLLRFCSFGWYHWTMILLRWVLFLLESAVVLRSVPLICCQLGFWGFSLVLGWFCCVFGVVDACWVLWDIPAYVGTVAIFHLLWLYWFKFLLIWRVRC